MNSTHLNIGLAFVFILLGESVAHPQDKDTLKPQDVIITKDYDPTISDAIKLSSTPKLQHSLVSSPEIKYSILNTQIKTTFDVEPIQAAKMKGEPLEKLYKSYMKFGLGSYTTTFAEVFVNNSRSREHAIGAHVKHFASAGKLKGVGYSGFSDNEIDLYGKKFLRKHLISGGLDYNRSVVHFYGFNPADFLYLDKDNTKQRFSRLGANAGLQSFYKDSTKLNHRINLDYYHLSDLYDSKENNVLVSAQLSKFYAKELITLTSFIDYNYYTGIADTLSNGIIKLNPRIVSRGKKWRLRAGLGIFTEIGSSARFHFYPDAHFRYNVVGNLIIPYVGLTGKVERNNFRSLTDENPYLSQAIPMRNSNHKYEMYGGIRGAMGSDMSFNIKASKSRIIDMPFFVNDTLKILSGNRFEVIYDTVTVVKLSGELTYQKTEKLKLMLKGDYYSYNMTEELKPWHKPALQVTFSGVYDLKDKIVLRADVFAISEQTAKTYNPADGEYIGYGIYGKKLKGIIDLNLGLEYRYTKKISAFLNLNNLAGVRHYRWNNYPSQRINILGGITYSFWSK